MKKFIYALTTIFMLLFILTGCKENIGSMNLPNGYVISGVKYPSTTHLGSYNIMSIENREEDLAYKSRVIGVISFIGFLDPGNKDVSINNVNQNIHTGNGGLIGSGGKATNNVNVFDNGGVVIKIEIHGEQSEIREYLMQLKVKDDQLSPSMSLQYLKKGDTVSIPTIRKYYSGYDKAFGFSATRMNRFYRILNQIDYIYLHEITPPKEKLSFTIK